MSVERALLKQSIDEWHELLTKARSSLLSRDLSPPLPTLDIGLALIGIRRCGKSYLAFELSKNFPVEKVLYYNFEDPLFYSYNEVDSLNQLLSVAEEYRAQKIELLILDEIHNVEGWERWLRKLIDQKRYKIIVTGSSAKMLSSEISTSLTGRVIEFKVAPLSFIETIKFKGAKIDSESSYLNALREMLTWGGFPEVVKLPIENRSILLKQYLGDIVLKDIISRYQIRNKRALDQILTYYLTNLSSLHSYNSIAKAFCVDVVTVSEYTSYLSDTFLIKEVLRYHPNLKVQSRDTKKVYIGDLGFRTVGARSNNDDTGKLLENLIFNELQRRGRDIYYFKGKQEVDFIIVENYKPTEIIQVCSSNLEDKDTWEREINATIEAQSELKLKTATILSYNREERIKSGSRIINIIPAYKWLNGL